MTALACSPLPRRLAMRMMLRSGSNARSGCRTIAIMAANTATVAVVSTAFGFTDPERNKSIGGAPMASAVERYGAPAEREGDGRGEREEQ